MAKTYCINCGEAVEGAFCATCGTAVAASAATADAPAAEPTYSAPTSQAPTDGPQRSLQTGRLGYRGAVKSYFANYVNFEGRATQSAYWFAALFVLILGLVANLIAGGDSAPFSASPLASLVSLATFLPSLSVGIRRLHDTGRSGHYLWFAFIPIVGLILLIVWLASSSEPADNKYGPRP
jgi:uncharacterized membrane protein YhaH (DUF805 family)